MDSNNQTVAPFKSRFRYLPRLLILVLVFVGGVYVGIGYGAKKMVLDSSGAVDIKKVINLYSKTRSSSVDFNQFWALWDKVKANYVDQPVDDVKLFYGAMAGMVQGLGDPYSVYMPPKDAEQFASDLSGEFEGIGAEIGIKDSQLVVISPLPDSPAEKSGLRTNDKILKIDDKETTGITVEQAVSKIRGPEGTSVVLTIMHDKSDKIEEKKIKREKITIPTVKWEMKKNNIAYLRIAYFNQDTWQEFDKALRSILPKNPKGMVLDLRSNPGGFLETSVEVASEWVKSGDIVREKFSDGKINTHTSVGSHRLAGLPTVVLVDDGTASGSEIVAGALQDYSAAKLVGKKTFGKGSVQNFEALPDGSALKLTVAKWFTPKDRAINHEGIMPDITLEEMFVKNTDKNIKEEYKDVGLEKALELLK